MLPYVTAASSISWDSPNCGDCFQLTSTSGTTIYVTGIDECAPGPSGEMHFDLYPEAFNQLLGSGGYAAGHGYVAYNVVASSLCQGNKG